MITSQPVNTLRTECATPMLRSSCRMHDRRARLYNAERLTWLDPGFQATNSHTCTVAVQLPPRALQQPPHQVIARKEWTERSRRDENIIAVPQKLLYQLRDGSIARSASTDCPDGASYVIPLPAHCGSKSQHRGLDWRAGRYGESTRHSSAY